MKQGEIWLVDLNPTVGAEIRKTRPCVIANRDAIGKLPLKIACPITEWSEGKASAAWMVPIVAIPETGLQKYSVIDCFQPRAMSEKRFIKRLGMISPVLMEQVKRAIALVFGIDV